MAKAHLLMQAVVHHQLLYRDTVQPKILSRVQQFVECSHCGHTIFRLLIYSSYFTIDLLQPCDQLHGSVPCHLLGKEAWLIGETETTLAPPSYHFYIKR